MMKLKEREERSRERERNRGMWASGVTRREIMMI